MEQTLELLSKAEEKELLKKIKEGDMEARKSLIFRNLRLVSYIVKRYDTTYLELEDLISCGTIGLINAVDTFELETNFAFSTYAVRCIQNEIKTFIRKNNPKKKTISFDIPLDEEGNTLEKVLVGEENIDYNRIEQKEQYERLRELIKKLPLKKQQVVILYFGLQNNRRYSQPQIAQMLNISNSRVSSLLKEALEALRKMIDPKLVVYEKPTYEKNLYEYFNGVGKLTVDRALQTLSENDIAILKKRYGETFTQTLPLTIPPNEQRIYYKIMKKLRMKIYYSSETSRIMPEKETKRTLQKIKI